MHKINYFRHLNDFVKALRPSTDHQKDSAERSRNFDIKALVP